jgi:hypothetical protein
VTPAATSTFLVSGFPSPVTAGTAGTVTVTAKDAFGNTTPDYAGTVHFTSSDAQAGLPADSTLVNGTGTFAAVLFTAGAESIIATDTANGSVTGTQAGIMVTPAATSQFVVLTDAASPDVAGTFFDETVVAQDPYGNTDTNYRGTIHFSSGDPFGAALPADYTFQPTDQGTATFAGVTALFTAGTWDVTAADAGSGITGSALVNVMAAPAVAFQVLAPSTVSSGTAFDVTVIAVDPYGNTDTNYLGTVTFSTTDPDPGVVLPPDYTFQPTDQGMVTFPRGITLVTAGDQQVTVTDTTSGITGSATITVGSMPTLPRSNSPALAGVRGNVPAVLARDALFAAGSLADPAPVLSHPQHQVSNWLADDSWIEDLPTAS